MSVFSPFNPNGLEDRRKKLLSKVFQQAQQSRVSAAQGAHAFRTASPLHAAFRPQFTQGSNIAQSVLSNLGIMRGPNAGDVSPGLGRPVAPPHATPGPPPPTGDPVPAGGVPNTIPIGGIPGGTPGPQGPPGPGAPAEAQGIYNDPGLVQLPNSARPANIPLGGGLFYDPVNNLVTGSPGGGMGSAAGALGGGHGAFF